MIALNSFLDARDQDRGITSDRGLRVRPLCVQSVQGAHELADARVQRAVEPVERRLETADERGVQLAPAADLGKRFDLSGCEEAAIDEPSLDLQLLRVARELRQR